MTIHLTTVEIAELFEVTPRSIQHWHKAGCPRVSRGKWDARAVLEWWLQNVFDNREDVQDETLRQAKSQYWKWKAKREKVLALKDEGKVLSREDSDMEFAARAAAFRAMIEGLCNRLPPILVGRKIEEISAILKQETKTGLHELCRAGECWDEVEIDGL